MSYPTPAPQPQPRKKRGCMFWLLIAVVVVVGVIIVAAVASSGGGDDEPQPGVVASSDTGKTSDGGGAGGGEAADVVVDACIVEPNLGWPKAELTITNSSTKSSNYFVNVEFVDGSNVRLGEGVAVSTNVAPGQAVKTTAQGTGDAKGKTITCRVTKVDRMLAR